MAGGSRNDATSAMTPCKSKRQEDEMVDNRAVMGGILRLLDNAGEGRDRSHTSGTKQKKQPR